MRRPEWLTFMSHNDTVSHTNKEDAQHLMSLKYDHELRKVTVVSSKYSLKETVYQWRTMAWTNIPDWISKFYCIELPPQQYTGPKSDSKYADLLIRISLCNIHVHIPHGPDLHWGSPRILSKMKRWLFPRGEGDRYMKLVSYLCLFPILRKLWSYTSISQQIFSKLNRNIM
jgi:hypothetical protein